MSENFLKYDYWLEIKKTSIFELDLARRILNFISTSYHSRRLKNHYVRKNKLREFGTELFYNLFRDVRGLHCALHVISNVRKMLATLPKGIVINRKFCSDLFFRLQEDRISVIWTLNSCPRNAGSDELTRSILLS